MKAATTAVMVRIASFFGIGSPKTRAEITDDEASDVSSNYDAPAPAAPAPKAKQEKVKQERKSKSKTPVEEVEALNVESDNNQDDDDDEELPEDEYVVEKITNHIVDEDVSVWLRGEPSPGPDWVTDWRDQVRGEMGGFREEVRQDLGARGKSV